MKSKQKIFISYSHKDKKCYRDFRKHLNVLEEKKIADVWDDSKVQPGDSLSQKIFPEIEDSTIFVALVSPDYLGSTFCKKELKKAFKLERAGKIIIISIIIRSCNWEIIFGTDRLAILEGKTPILECKNKDKAFTNTIKKINERIEDMNSKQKEDIAGNKIKKINERVERMNPKQKEDIAGNKIKKINERVERMNSKQKEDIAGNKIKKINERVERMNSKQEEGIAGNKIKKNEVESHQTYRKKENSLKDNLGHTFNETKELHGKKLVVFLGGPDFKNKGTCEKAKLRDEIFDALEEEYDVFPKKNKNTRYLQENDYDDAQYSELEFIQNKCQAVVIIPDSPGSFCEFGLFSWHYAYGNIKDKCSVFIALVDEHYEDHESYFNEGPIRSLESYAQVRGHVIWVNYNNAGYGEYIKRVKRILYSENILFRKMG